MKSKLIFLTAIIPILMLTIIVPNVYASGPRGDSPDGSTREGANCWVEGYDAGFAQKYDKDRADQCKNAEDDEYNASWKYGCIDSGLTKIDCDQIKDNPEHIEHESLQEENRRNCYDDGYEDGRNNPFDRERNNGCNDYQDMYYKGFIAGCESAGNTKEMCSSSGHNNNSGDNSNEPDRLKVTATLNVPSSWCGREFQVTLRTEGVSYTEYKDGCTGDVEFAPAPIDMNEEFTVCAQASNGAVSGCQSGVNGPESESERITIDVG